MSLCSSQPAQEGTHKHNRCSSLVSEATFTVLTASPVLWEVSFFFLCTNSSLQHNRPLNLGSSHKRWPKQSIPVFFIKKTIEPLNTVRSGCCSIQRDHRHQSKKDQHQIFDIKYRNKQVTGTELASIQHNLTHTSVPQREDNVFSIKFNSECSGLLW